MRPAALIVIAVLLLGICAPFEAAPAKSTKHKAPPAKAIKNKKPVAKKSAPEVVPAPTVTAEAEEVAAVEIIAPQEGDVLDEIPVLVAAGFAAKDMRFLLDGQPVSGEAFTSERIISILPAVLKAGDHAVEISATDAAGKALTDTCDFRYMPRVLPLHGSVELLAKPVSTTRTLPWVPYEYSGRFNADAPLGWAQMRLDLYYTTRDVPTTQPYNRHTFQLYVGEKMDIRLGDTTPKFSDLTLNGILIRGATAKFKLSGLEIAGIYGDSKRAVFDRTGSNYTFAQKAYGVRSSIDFWGVATVGLNALRVTDDQNSLSTYEAVKPQDDILASCDTTLSLDQGRTTLSGEYAASLYYRDTTASAVDVAGIPAYIKRLFPIRLGMNYDSAYQLKLDSILGPTRWLLRYRNIGPGFVSLGNVSLTNDLAELELRNSFQVRNFSFQGFYKGSNDNLGGIKETTTRQYQYGINIGFPLPNYAYIALGLNSSAAKNNATGTAEVRDYISDSYNLGLTSIRFNLGVMPASLSLNYALVNYRDRNTATTLPEYQNHTYTLDTAVNISRWLILGIGFGWSRRIDQGALAGTTDFENGRGRLDWRVSEDRSAYAETLLIFGSNSRATISTQKYSVKAGILQKLANQGTISLDLEHIQNRDALAATNNFNESSASLKYRQEF